MIVGKIYSERGKPVVVLAQWRGLNKTERGPVPGWLVEHRPRRFPVRNVLIRRADGTLVVRPFRGLRRTRYSDAFLEMQR